MLAALTLLLAAAPRAQGPAGEALPFERLGGALLEAADDGRRRGGEVDAQAPAEQQFQERLAPLFERAELGAVQLWLPRKLVTPDAKLARAKRLREWKAIAEGVLALEERWLDALGLRRAADAAELERAFATLRASLRGTTAKGSIAAGEDVLGAGRRLREAMLGEAWRAHGLALIVAPTRAQYVALIGASGVHWPEYRAELWIPAVRRSANQRICRSVLAFPLAWGPRDEADPWFEQFPMEAGDARQQAVHAASHLISSVVVPSAPMWLCEGLAVRDTVLLEGADETLCAGYQGREATPFDGWANVPQAFFVYARLERSPFRGTGSNDVFADELRNAWVEGGFRIVDLDRARPALVTPGPFLGDAARVPDEVAAGPSGLKEGFAEFFRAYCAAFGQWLSEREVDGAPLLEATLRGLRQRGLERSERENREASDLEAVLHALTGSSLGAGLDAERDLEAEFAAWLRSRR